MGNDGLGWAADTFAAGGWVMVPLAVLSLWMWTLIVAKAVQFWLWRREERRASMPGGRLLDGDWRVQLQQAFHQARCGDVGLDAKLMHSLSHRWLNAANRHVGTILVLAGVAPLLGIIGTVTGMMSTFDAIGRYGTGNVGAMSTGVSEALITTQAGLAVSIPGLVVGHFLRRRAQRLCSRIDRFCAGVGRCCKAERTTQGEVGA